jgi:L-ascorbate metabolism protein UlaG (beta-lactamase superfamily)
VAGLKAICTSLMLFKIFGKNPAGARQKKIEQSVHFKNGVFNNLTPTDVMLKDTSYIRLMRDFFNKPNTNVPSTPIPAIKTDLQQLPADQPVIVWFGHSSYLIKYQGTTILVDPVLSGQASPVAGFGKAFTGTNIYDFSDLPPIDIVIITHDHYDHLDYKTILELKNTPARFYTALGVGAHLELWGVEPGKITELDWWQSTQIDTNLQLTATPARHFSGRSFQRNKTLWASFVLKLYGYRLLLGGDSGYGDHFRQIGASHGPFDLAILEAGQYGDKWPYIHMFPDETVRAAMDLQARMLLPVHWGRFALAYHAWYEPIERVMEYAEKVYYPVIIPQIGKPIRLKIPEMQERWWKG